MSCNLVSIPACQRVYPLPPSRMFVVDRGDFGHDFGSKVCTYARVQCGGETRNKIRWCATKGGMKSNEKSFCMAKRGWLCHYCREMLGTVEATS